MPSRLAGLVLLLGGLLFGGLALAQPLASPPAPAQAKSGAINYTYEIVATYPHDPNAFTQGLVWERGALLESTGLNGKSSLRRVELATGKVLKQENIPAEYFAEGIVALGGKIFQLTWQNGKGFIYDQATFQRVGEFPFAGEGWGLTSDGIHLIASDGSHILRFLDPTTFEVKRSLAVTLDGKPVSRLNELEFIQGEVFANVWMTNFLVRVDLASGAVTGVIDLNGLLPSPERTPETDVLNGIAYDPEKDRYFVTGKRWPKLFEIKLKPK